jgi:hypothetical protein
MVYLKCRKLKDFIVNRRIHAGKNPANIKYLPRTYNITIQTTTNFCYEHPTLGCIYPTVCICE